MADGMKVKPKLSFYLIFFFLAFFSSFSFSSRDQRLVWLKQSSRYNPIIRVTIDNLAWLLKSPRDYCLIVHLSALNSGCRSCHLLYQETSVLSQFYSNRMDIQSIFFLLLDYNKEIHSFFIDLNLHNIPTIFLVPPTPLTLSSIVYDGYHYYEDKYIEESNDLPFSDIILHYKDTYDFPVSIFSLNSSLIHNWITNELKSYSYINIPEYYTEKQKILDNNSTFLRHLSTSPWYLLIIFTLFYARKHIYFLLTTFYGPFLCIFLPFIWAVSGLMYCLKRSTSFLYVDSKTFSIYLIHPSPYGQFTFEGLFIGFLIISICLCITFLITINPQSPIPSHSNSTSSFSDFPYFFITMLSLASLLTFWIYHIFRKKVPTSLSTDNIF